MHRAPSPLTWLAAGVSMVLFVLLFPVLDVCTHPISVLVGRYVPLLIRLSELYSDTPLLPVALLGVPLLLVSLVVLAQWRHFGLVHSALLLVTPFTLTLFFQYLIVVQLDTYLVECPAAIPWQNIFQLPLIAHCLKLLLIYLCVTAVLWVLVFLARRAVTIALKRRSS